MKRLQQIDTMRPTIPHGTIMRAFQQAKAALKRHDTTSAPPLRHDTIDHQWQRIARLRAMAINRGEYRVEGRA